MNFTKLTDVERTELINALRNNAFREDTIIMNKRDTSFIRSTEEDVEDEEVINAIKSVPCHY